MCGFIALIDKIPHKNIVEAYKSLEKRGLSGTLAYDQDNYIGHHLLHISTENPQLQPLVDGNKMFCFAGEILNFSEFGNYESDTDMLYDHVVNHRFEELSPKYYGFWSWAMTDSVNKSLIACTDYLSHKPLYYRTDIRAVSSEPRALSLLAPCSMDQIHFSNIMKWGYDPTGRTGWEQIRQMPPGSLYFNGYITQYWDWNSVSNVSKSSGNLYVLLNNSVKMNLLSKRRTSMLLSGGLDSSIIYSLIREQGHHIRAYHVENGEEDYIKDLCSDYVRVDLPEGIEVEAVYAHQSPVDLGSVVPQLQLARALKGEHVVLTGDGADELFAGYGRNEKYDSRFSDTFTELPYYHHPRLDRLMMSETIELRSPFSNSPELVKYALSLPHRPGKKELIDTFGHLLPDSIKNREKKALKTAKVESDRLTNTIQNISFFRALYE
jgi:asparagine synthase (glutamine-hydrolysing)